ncbi:MAG TPA: RagB/SusD family nutrient uptake outer membrane protein, partial [Chitinophagaceae bacterium]|nr:RagB/SusD family nutrient uptake outer membrane protein [Chitinophagaceae bacterium]
DFNNDIRNSNYNFVRTYTYNDAGKPAYYGKTISTEAPPPGVTVPRREFYAYQSKCTTPGKHPDALFQDKSKLLLTASAGGTYTDQYMFRLAETYLIRAEAYLGAGNPTNAAADINVVRSRSNASPVVPANVNINYILDERMRELGVEEKRRLTLARLGLVYDRTVNVAQNPVAANIKPYHNLWPVPQTEIDRNKDAKLAQNPGYQ